MRRVWGRGEAQMSDNKPQQERTDVDMERAVIGAALFGAENLSYIVDNVRAEDLSTQPHRIIRQHLVEMYDSGRSVDRNTLISSLSASGSLAQAGGETYVRSLESAVPFGPFDLPSYCGILQDLTIGRKLMAIGDQIKTQAMSGTRYENVISQAQTYLRALGEYSDDQGSLLDPNEIIERDGGVEKLLNPYGNDKGIVPPWPALEEAIGGLHGGELVTIGGNPGTGKSSMAAQIMYAAAVKGKLVAYFSHEMRSRAILRRLICGVSNVPATDFRNNQLDKEQRRRVKDALDIIIPLPMNISDVSGRNVLQMAAEIRKLQARRKQKVDLVIIDHVQLVRGRGNHYFNQTQELTEISGDLKEYTLKNDVAMIVLSQLNRDNTKRKDGRPELQDLRASGSLEQDSDGVWLIHRPEFYDRNNPLLRGQVILILAKQPEGEVRDVELRWNGAYTRFESRPEAA